jgi:hypothetical protein
VALVVGAVFASAGVASVAFVDGFGAVLGAFFALVGLAVMGNGLRHLIARSAFKQAHLEALGPVPPGGHRDAASGLTPRRPLRLTGNSKLKVMCTEQAHDSTSNSSRRYTNTLFTREQPLELPSRLSHHLEQRIAVPIPEDIPPTWSGSSNAFFTKVEARVGLDGWRPDLILEAPVEVLPEVAWVSDWFDVWLERNAYAVGAVVRGKVLFPDPLDERLAKVRAVNASVRARVHGSGNGETVTAFEGPSAGRAVT